MDFSDALNVVKRDGEKISREGWNAKNMFVVLSPGFTLKADRIFSPAIQEDVSDGEGVFRPYLMMRTVDGEYVPWVASQTDILADDWVVEV